MTATQNTPKKFRKATVDQRDHVASHGKEAKGKGTWAFSTYSNPQIDDVFFCRYATFAQCVKEANEHFGGVEVLFAQP